MNKIKVILLTLLTALTLVSLTLPICADDNERCTSHVCDVQCHDGLHRDNHNCNNRHDRQCSVVVTNVVNLTNLSTLVISVTNIVTETVVVTETVTVTNVVSCPVEDLAVTDYSLVKSHIYRLYVASQTSGGNRGVWRNWGSIRSGSNHVARLILPLASVKPLYWQLVDVTIGVPHVAVAAQEPSCINAVSYIALVQGRLYRIPDSSKPNN